MRIDSRIRVWQHRGIRQNDIVALDNISLLEGYTGALYKVTRAYHGTDEDGAALITDLSLEVYTP